MKSTIYFLSFCLASVFAIGESFGQLYIVGGGFTIDSGAVVTVKGDLNSVNNISGSGKVIMNGAVNQYLNMNGNAIPNLEINNTQNITLISAARVLTALSFVNGRIIAGNFGFTLGPSAAATGMGTGKFIETSGSGQVFKELSANVTSYEMPVGVSTVYRPVFLSTSASAYSSAKVGVRALTVSHPNRTSFSSDYLKMYWPITRTGITGTVTAVGQYADPTDITGTETKLRGCFYDGTQWSNTGSTYDATLNRVGASVATAGGSLYGMTRFSMLGLKAFLQGAYTSNAMSNTYYSLGLSADSTAVDSVTINLWSPISLAAANPGYSYKALLHTDGTTNILLPEATISNSYYLALKHRSSIETWSASAVAISDNISYDFTTAASKAYGNNMINMGGGKYAFYSGDINQDGMIEAADYSAMENDVLAILFGYYVSDLSGDGVVEAADYSLMENNVLNIVFAARP